MRSPGFRRRNPIGPPPTARASHQLLKRAVSAFGTEELPDAEAIRWLWLGTHAAHDLWDDDGWAEQCGRQIALARRAGALTP